MTWLVLFLAALLVGFGLAAPAQAQSVCPTSWDWSVDQFGVGSSPSGTTADGGSVTWPIESGFSRPDVLFANIATSTTVQITSTNTAVARVGFGGQVAYATLMSTGSTILTAEFQNPGCDPITLNVTVGVTIAPTAGDTTTGIDANSAGKAVNLNVAGWDITSVAVASPPANGIATVSGTSISYRPNPGFSGTDTFTYTATNAAGTSAPATATITVGAPTIALAPTEGALPGASAGSAYSQFFTASGGIAPYTFEVTAGNVPAGLSFAMDGTLSGTPTESGSFTFTVMATDDNGFTGTRDYTLSIVSAAVRPDPALDAEVIGLVRSQTGTAKRFANIQISNFSQRLEQLHSEGERLSNSIGVNVGVQQPGNSAHAYAPHAAAGQDPALAAIGQAAPETAGDSSNVQPAPVENLFGELAYWSGGYVNFGTNDNGALNLDHTLVGVSAGMDYRFTPELIAGFGVGYGRDVTDIGSHGSESRAEAFSIAAYGSYWPVPDFFIDGLAGYSLMSFDSLRYVTAAGDFASGSRSGDQFFAALSAGYEYRHDGLLMSPYGRLSGSRSVLNGFTETGAGIWNLAYGEQTVDTISGTLGLRLHYAIPMEWGVLTPRGRLEYTHDFSGSSRASFGYVDLGTLPYSVDADAFSRDHLSVGLGLDAQFGESLNLGLDYRTAFSTSGDSRDHTFAFKLGVRY